MRDVLQTEELDIPSGVTVAIKSRLITVTGPRGTLNKNVQHVSMDIRLIKSKAEGQPDKVTLAVWQGGRKHVACLRTIKSLINNMITGVTKVRRSNRRLEVKICKQYHSGFPLQKAHLFAKEVTDF